MVVKMSAPGRSFGGVADYCLHDPRMPGEAHHPESAERVEWTETRNLATSEGERAGRIMAATAEAATDLKHLAGGAATGRKLEKPVCHYSLNWAKDEKPDRKEMLRAAAESLKALGMERNQALIVSHRDGQPHVHVIANRVDPESGKAAGLSRSKLRLSKWAERYEREQGKIRCPERERNNMRRAQGERVVDGRGHSGGRWRRERMNPQQEREAIPAAREGLERERAAWQRGEERMHWERIQQWREKDLGKLERRSKWEWSELYGRQERQREQLAKDCHGVLGRFRAWRELGGKLREIGGTIRGRAEVLGRFQEELETRQRLERISLGKAHSEAVRKIESLAGEVYRGGMEGAEGRAREATRRDPLAVYNRYRGGDWYKLERSASEERMEQVREFDGEQAYEKMMRAMEEARQEKARQAEKARQVERARLEWARQETARQSRERRGPERGGPERDFGPSR